MHLPHSRALFGGVCCVDVTFSFFHFFPCFVLYHLSCLHIFIYNSALGPHCKAKKKQCWLGEWKANQQKRKTTPSRKKTQTQITQSNKTYFPLTQTHFLSYTHAEHSNTLTRYWLVLTRYIFYLYCPNAISKQWFFCRRCCYLLNFFYFSLMWKYVFADYASLSPSLYVFVARTQHHSSARCNDKRRIMKMK